MRRISFLLALALCIVGVPVFVYAHSEVKTQEIAEGSPYVIQLTVASQGPGSTGTGVVTAYNDKRYILTNAHVAGNAIRIWANALTDDGVMEEIEIVSVYPALDLALLTEPSTTKHLSPVTFGDSDKLKLGEEVYALGFPFGMRAANNGSISALKLPSNPFFLLTQAPLNPGNSGGPLFNKNHEMVGMNSQIARGANLVGFSIPVNVIKHVLPRLASERVVLSGTLSGINVVDTNRVTPFSFKQRGLPFPPSRKGPIVMAADTEAARNGIAVGDIVVGLDKIPIASYRELAFALLDRKPNEEVTLTLVRGTEEVKVKVRLIDSMKAEE